MKPNTITRHVESTIQGDDVRMGIAEGAEEFVVSMLTDLYEHPTYAIVREYSTNARDAHVEAGIDRPIEITLPTEMEPYLKIRDHGVGMDDERIKKNYAQYGGSTKRDSDELQGFLGVGCKAALTYTEMFTVVSVRDGEKIIATVERLNEGDLPTLRIISKEPTDDENGTEVQINVRRGYDMRQVHNWAKHHFRFWAKGTVLVDGKEPERIGGLRLNERLLVTQETEGQDYLVMGNVAYPTTIKTDLDESYGLVAFVGIGEMNFAPSREAPRMTSLTVNCIARVEGEFVEGIRAAIQRDVDKAAGKPDALKVAVDWRRVFGQNSRKSLDLVYKGSPVPVEFTFGKVKVSHPLRPKEKIEQEVQATFTNHDSDKLSHKSKHKSAMAGTLLNGALVTGFNLNDFSATHKKKLKMWAEDKGVSVKTFILIDTPLPKGQQSWLPKERVVAWETVNAYKLPRNLPSRLANRVSGTFEVAVFSNGKYDNGWKRVENVDADAIAEHDYVFYTDKHALGGDAWRGVGTLLSKRKGGVVVFLPQNRINKFKRGFPAAKSTTEALAEIYRRTAAKVTEQDQKVYALKKSGNLRNKLQAIDPSRIKDPEIHALRAVLDTPMGKAAENLLKMQGLRHYLNVKDPFDTSIANNDPFDKYPMYEYNAGYRGRDFRSMPDEMYLYMNAKYDALVLEGEKEN